MGRRSVRFPAYLSESSGDQEATVEEGAENIYIYTHTHTCDEHIYPVQKRQQH